MTNVSVDRTQYHGQDGLGRYRYSYRHPGSRREEYVDEKGRVQGSFSYKSDDGKLRAQSKAPG